MTRKVIVSAIIFIACAMNLRLVFAETVEEVQKSMAEASRPTAKHQQQRRLLSAANGELERTRTYEGYGELNVIKGRGVIQVSFAVDDYFTTIESARIDLYAYDVDYPWATEYDEVYINGRLIGRLRGDNETWVPNFFDVPISAIRENATNELAIVVDIKNEGWVTGVDNVSLVLRGNRGNTIKNVKSQYCEGNYGNGKKGTFLTGVDCEIEFEVEYASIVRQIDHLIVNGERVSDLVMQFNYNVGRLHPGDSLEVVAVDTDGNESEPFRVNLDIADYPPLWSGITRIFAEQHPEDGYILYTTAEISMLSLFDAVDDGLDIAGQEFPLAVKPAIQVYQTFESDTAQFHAGSDMGGSVKKLQSLGHFAALELGASFSNDKVRQWQPLSQTWVDVDRDMGVKISGKARPPKFRLPACPLAYAEIWLATDLGFSVQEEDGQWLCDIKGDPLVSVRGSLGLGVDGLAKAEGYLQGGLLCDAVVPGNPNHIQRLGLQAKAGLIAVIGVFEHNIFPPWETTYFLIGGNRARLMASAGDISPLDMDDAGWTLISRDYAYAGGGRRRLLASSGTSGSLGDGYPYPSPSLAASGANDILLYLRDNNARTAVNRTELVCRTGTGDEWSSAEVVWPDGTADFMPNVAANANGTVVAAWVNVGKELAHDATLSDMCRSMEIAVGIMDSATGAWDCGNLTCDAALDVAPKVKVAADGSAVVAWVRNEYGEFFGSSDKPSSIMMATYREGSWSSPVIVAENIGMVYSFDVAYDGVTASVVYAKDGDGDMMTDEAREVWIIAVSGGVPGLASKLSSDGADATRPFAWYDAEGALRILWLEGEDMVSSTGFGERRTIVADCDIPPDYSPLPRADGGVILVWNRLADSQAGTETVCATYDPASGIIGEPSVLLYSETEQERGITGAVGSDGTLRMAYESVSVTTNVEGIAEYGTVELRTLRKESGIDVGFAPDAFSFEGEVVIGEMTNILVKVTNFGVEMANGATVSVWIGEGERTLLGSVVTNIPPLSVVTVSVPWLVAQGEDIVFMASVEHDSFVDRNETNDAATWRPLFADAVSLHNLRCIREDDASRYIGVTVRNNGLAPLEEGTELRFWRGGLGGELLASTNLPTVLSGSGNGCEVGFTWDFNTIPITSAVERVVVELVYGDSHPTASVDVEATMCTVKFADKEGNVLDIDPIVVPYGSAIGELPTLDNGYEWWMNGYKATSSTCVCGNLILSSRCMVLYTIENSEVKITGCYPTLVELSVPSMIEGCPVTSIGDAAFYNRSGLKSVVIPDGVTSIGDFAFDNCSGLESVSIPASVTHIGNRAFYGCNNVKNATVPGWKCDIPFNGVTNLVISAGASNIVDYAFHDSVALISISIPNSVKVIGQEAFKGCVALESVTIPESVTSIDVSAFSCCSSIRSVTVPQDVLSYGLPMVFWSSYASITNVVLSGNVNDIRASAFSGCVGLEKITVCEDNEFYSSNNGLLMTKDGAAVIKAPAKGIAGAVTIPDGVTVIGSYAFEGCDGIMSVMIPEGVADIGQCTFYGCSGLTSIDIPDSVTNIWNQAFCDCIGLTSVALGGNVASIGDDAFKGCGGIVSVTVPQCVCSKELAAVFPSYQSITNVVIQEGVTNIGMRAFSDCSGLVEVAISDGVRTVGDWAFCNCTNLVYVNIPDSVTSIGDWSFYGCSGLVCVTFGDGLTSIGDCAFRDCSGLKSVVIPDSVTSIGEDAFMDCSSLTSVAIPDSVTNIGDYPFSGCGNITSVMIPQCVCSQKLSEVFPSSYFQSITNVVIADGTTEIGEYMLWYCRSLASVEIPDSVTNIGRCAFYECTDLARVDFGNGVMSIGGSAFQGCPNITEVILPRSIISLASYAFPCSGLMRAYLPSSMKGNVDWDVFSGCPSGFSIIYYEGDAPSFDKVATITFDANGGSTAYESEEFLVGCPFVSLPKATKPGLSFEGWFTEPEGGEEITEETVASESMTVYAHWGDLHCEFTIVNGELRGVELNGETEITIPAGVTSIGQYAFSGCAGLVSVTIPEGVTNIGYAAFYRCSGLMRIYLPRSLRFISSEAFDFCYNIQELHVADIAAWCTVSIDGVYAHPLSSNSWGSGRIYEGEELLSQLAIPSGVGSVGAYAFYGCGSLTSVTMPESCGSVGTGAFRLCRSLESVETGDGVTSIGEQAFYACSALSYLDLGSNVVSIGADAFYNCGSLAEITIPDSVMTIGSRAFQYCYQLSRISFMGNAPTVDDYAFWYMFADPVGLVRRDSTGWHVFEGMKWKGALTLLYEDDLAPVDDGGPVTEYFITDGVLVDVDLDGATSATIPDGVTSIGDEAFRGCEDLTSVVIPNSVISIGNSAFYNCYRLTDVTMTGGLTSIGNWAFGRCALTSVAMPDSVTNIGEYAFYECYKLESVTLGNGLTRIGNYVFSGCENLKTAYVPVTLDIDVDAVFAGTSQELEIIYTGEYVECTVRFDANGGSVGETERIRASGKRMGSLPEIARDGYLFAGWFTAAKGGDLVTAETIVTSDMTVYAQWQKVFVVPVATFESTGGDANWTYADGVWCSGDIEDDQNTWAQISVTGPCQVSFSWKASSESVSYDYLYITVDGIESGSEDRIGGETDWIAKIISIGASSHYVRWTYKKDSSVSSGSDCAWLKDVVIIKPEDAEPASVPTVEVSEKMAEPIVDEMTGVRTIEAKEGETITEYDVESVKISSPLDSTKYITAAYNVEFVDGKIEITLATPKVEEVDENKKAEDDPSGMLANVDPVQIEDKPTPDVEKGEEVGALPVKTYPGLYYRAAWGDDLGGMTEGNKVQATGDSLYLGVIKQKGPKGFYRLTVSEK